eukprot:121230-Pleurochrysis_carterae.AAC.1
MRIVLCILRSSGAQRRDCNNHTSYCGVLDAIEWHCLLYVRVACACIESIGFENRFRKPIVLYFSYRIVMQHLRCPEAGRVPFPEAGYYLSHCSH